MFSTVTKIWLKAGLEISAAIGAPKCFQNSYTLVTGFGRSGTTSVANFFSSCHAQAVHEPWAGDNLLNVWALAGYRERVGFAVRHIRGPLMRERCREHPFVEINSLTLPFYSAIKAAYPEIRIIFVLRDPRKIALSMLNRETWRLERTILSDPTVTFTNIVGNDAAALDFETRRQIAVLSYIYEHLEAAVSNDLLILNFDRFISDYDYALEWSERIASIRFSEETWQRFFAAPQNATIDRRYQKSEDLSKPAARFLTNDIMDLYRTYFR